MGWIKELLGIEHLNEKQKKEQDALGNKIVTELKKLERYDNDCIIQIDPNPMDVDTSYVIIVNHGRRVPNHYIKRIAEIRIYIDNYRREINLIKDVMKDGKEHEETSYYRKDQVEGVIEIVKRFTLEYPFE